MYFSTKCLKIFILDHRFCITQVKFDLSHTTTKPTQNNLVRETRERKIFFK